MYSGAYTPKSLIYKPSLRISRFLAAFVQKSFVLVPRRKRHPAAQDQRTTLNDDFNPLIGCYITHTYIYLLIRLESVHDPSATDTFLQIRILTHTH